MRMLVQFKKDDLVRHLGLLDLQRTIQRALRRSGLPIRYSNGFNPHMVMNFASALSAGIPGDAEVLDVALNGEVTQEECLEAFNRVVPPSLRASRVRIVDDSFPKAGAALQQAQYLIGLHGKEGLKAAQAVERFLAQEEIMALRKTKRSESMVNIRPMIHEMTVHDGADENKTQMTVRVSFVEAATLKPELLLDSLCSFAGAEKPKSEIRRTCLLGVVNGQAVPLMDM